MIELRKTPLFVRIGLMWWIVLLAQWPSRIFLLYGNAWGGLAGSTAFAESPVALRIVVSLAHALGAGWVVVRWLRSTGPPGKTFWSLAGWAILLPLFAVLSWWIVFVSMSMFEPGATLVERLGRVLFWLSWSPYAVYLAFRQYWLATWVLVPLAIATVLLVRQELASSRGTATPSGSPSA